MTRHHIQRSLAALVAIVAWAALALQYMLIIDNLGPGLGTWRYLGYFTILANIAVALVASGIALGRDNRLTEARAGLMALTTIVTVGITYSLLLRSIWSPTGWQKVADVALHDVTPILFTILWAAMPHGGTRWRDLGWALVGPALYFAYALARGAFDGWYAYYFLDPTQQGTAAFLASILGMIAVFTIVAAAAIALDRRFSLPQDRSAH